MDIEKICALGRSVIEIEAKEIANLSSRIDHHFAKACELLLNCEGRIAVTGVGKSGHISKKIAATFASTGSPAFFIHPNEAKHGDIGMITKKDVVIALSNSGESEEITSILLVISRLGVPLITLTGRPNSTLAKAATVNLDVSVEKEACPLGLAPTSSTTAALVMGDALAMALLEHRGFTKNDFALSHPGGLLGRRLLLKVESIMHTDTAVPIVSYLASLKDALVEMTQKKLGITTVINELGELAGIFTDGDVRRAFDKNADIHQTQIQHVMTKNPKTITGNLLAADALSLMESYKITSLIVTNEIKQPIGVVHIHDILRAGVF
jgi:arabinose-5-phosphate isomerase